MRLFLRIRFYLKVKGYFSFLAIQYGGCLHLMTPQAPHDTSEI